MGCGASNPSSSSTFTSSTSTSTNVQIAPINNQPEIDTIQTKSWIDQQQQQLSNQSYRSNRLMNSFTFTNLLLPCRFITDNSSSSLDLNNQIYNSNVKHCQIQTDLENMIGFKCQHTQTDTINMSDDEFDAMILALDEQEKLQSQQSSDKLIYNQDIEEENDDDDLISTHKKIFSALSKKDNPNKDREKQFVNVAVQATKKKSSKSTQTKFGSIDHCFIPKNKQQLIELSKNLTNAIIECRTCDDEYQNSNDINKNDMNIAENNLKKLLSSFDDDDIIDDEYTDTNHNDKNDNDEIDDGYESNKIRNDDQNETISNNALKHKNNPIDTLWYLQSKRLIQKHKVQDCIFLLLDDIRKKKSIEQLLPNTESNNPIVSVQKKDVSLQTMNDILTDESPEFAARSPLCCKKEMIPSTELMFNDLDEKILNYHHEKAEEFFTAKDLSKFICERAKNDLFKIRALFIWITKNITLNTDDNGQRDNLISSEILKSKRATNKNYCHLFYDVCRLSGIRCKIIDGFVRDYNYRPGYHFQPSKDKLSSWNAVFVLGSWRFIDLTLAAGYTDNSGEFHAKTNEYYFLTDPNVMIWTHFPYNEMERNYDRWQLLDKPLTLDEFNEQPKVMENFFEYNLRLRSKIANPLEFRISTEIKIGSHEAMRYKYKLYPSDETENSSLNYYVFCQLKEDRLVGSFMVQPPFAGRFILKIFAKPEREMNDSLQDLTTPLDPVLIMLLDCTKARKYIEPFPLNDIPWGLTQKFYDYKLRFSNQKGPIIVTWGGRRRLILESNETMLLTYSLYDSDSMEMDTRNIIIREDPSFKTTIFTINPPRVGTFKFILFGMPKPKQKGKWRLPMLATLMIDCKLIKPSQHDEDQFVTTTTTTPTATAAPATTTAATTTNTLTNPIDNNYSDDNNNNVNINTTNDKKMKTKAK